MSGREGARKRNAKDLTQRRRGTQRGLSMALRVVRLAVVVVGMCVLLIGAARLPGEEDRRNDMIALAAYVIQRYPDYGIQTVRLYLINSGERTVRVAASGHFTGPVVWTSDGRHLLYGVEDEYQEENNYQLLDVVTGDIKPVLLPDAAARVMTVLNGGYLVLKQENSYLYFDPVSDQIIDEFPFEFKENSHPSWSPNGHYIGYAIDLGYVIQDIKQHETLYQIDSRGSLWWSGSERYVAFQSAQNNNWYLIEMTSGERSLLPNLPLAWSPDETAILVRIENHLYIYDLEEKSSRLLSIQNFLDEGSAGWSPDGTQIAVAAYRPDDSFELVMMNTDGKSSYRVGFNAELLSVMGIAWQPTS
jgi:hypothetical protein